MRPSPGRASVEPSCTVQSPGGSRVRSFTGRGGGPDVEDERFGAVAREQKWEGPLVDFAHG